MILMRLNYVTTYVARGYIGSYFPIPTFNLNVRVPDDPISQFMFAHVIPKMIVNTEIPIEVCVAETC